MLIAETITDTSSIHPNKIAINCDGELISYNILKENIHSMQQRLITVLGEPSEKKIAFLLINDHQFLTLFLAISQLGAIAIPLDPKWSKQDMEYILINCEPDLLISEQQVNGILSMSFDEFLKQTRTNLPDQLLADENLFYIGYTSGTTGKPKGYLRSQSSWIHSFKASDEAFNIHKEDVIFSPGPLVHSHFLYAALHGLHKGATVYITKKFDAESVYHTLTTCPITTLYLVPTMFSALTERCSERKPIFYLKKVISAGAKWHPTLKQKSTFLIPNAKVFEFYGASELSLVSVLDERGNQEKPESVGKAIPGVEISIRKSDGTEADIGEIGKLFIKSKLLFSGYHKLPEATKEVFHGDWATVGDLAFLDSEGFITIVGREKNMIISGGLNIFPEEVEKFLITLPEIEEAIAIGIEDPYWGEKLVAVITWKEGKRLTSDQLKKFCKQNLASYKCPQQFVELNSFPYTTSQKIARKEVKKLIEKQLKHQGM
jgi:long-chain acyl-CoA synthetase